MLLVDTASVPCRDRLELVVESITGAAGATAFTAASPSEEVRLTMSRWDLGPVELFDAQASAHTLSRSEKAPPGDEAPAILLTYGLQGTGVHRHFGKEVTFGPSTLWGTDPAHPYDHRVTDTRTLTAKVPVDALGVPTNLIGPALGHLSRSPLAPLFSNHIAQVHELADRLDRAAALALGSATLSLARALVVSVTDDDRLGREAMEDALLLRVASFVRDHLGDRDLDAAAIAAAHHVSVGHLYKACAHVDLRLEQWIIEERLARAAEDLARTSPGREPIAEIARRWGFTNASHFASRFRRTYGVTPREWRRDQRSAGPPQASP